MKCATFALAGLMLLAGLAAIPVAAEAQMGTPLSTIRPAPPLQTVPPLTPQPSPAPAPVPPLPVQPPTQVGPVPPPGTPQLTIPLKRPPPPAVAPPPVLQRSADEPRSETLTRCNTLATAQAQTECRRRAGVQYRAQ
jgi:hypothetical protein